MKWHLPSTDRDELARLLADAHDPVLVDRLISKVSMLSPRAIYEVEKVVGCFPRTIAHRPNWSWFWRAADSVVEIDPIYAPVLRRLDLAAEIYHIREPQKIPLVMSRRSG
jgi:hypothetical protein